MINTQKKRPRRDVDGASGGSEGSILKLSNSFVQLDPRFGHTLVGVTLGKAYAIYQTLLLFIWRATDGKGSPEIRRLRVDGNVFAFVRQQKLAEYVGCKHKSSACKYLRKLVDLGWIKPIKAPVEGSYVDGYLLGTWVESEEKEKELLFAHRSLQKLCVDMTIYAQKKLGNNAKYIQLQPHDRLEFCERWVEREIKRKPVYNLDRNTVKWVETNPFITGVEGSEIHYHGYKKERVTTTQVEAPVEAPVAQREAPVVKEVVEPTETGFRLSDGLTGVQRPRCTIDATNKRKLKKRSPDKEDYNIARDARSKDHLLPKNKIRGSEVSFGRRKKKKKKSGSSKIMPRPGRMVENSAASGEGAEALRRAKSLEKLWRDLYASELPDAETPWAWSQRVALSVMALVDEHGEDQVSRVMKFAVQRWDLIEEKWFKGRGDVPYISLIYKCWDGLSKMEAEYGVDQGEREAWDAMQEEWVAWHKENPHAFAPSGLTKRYNDLRVTAEKQGWPIHKV